MKRFISLLLLLMMIASLFTTSASAAGIPNTCPKCGAVVQIKRDGYDYEVSYRQTIGNAVYMIYETRHSYSTVCINNHGCDGYYVKSVKKVLMGYTS